MAVEPVETGSPFNITEVGGDGVAVSLTDRAQPYRPFELTTKGRIEITWYPGNPEATSTVLGSAEDPTHMNGWWKDKYLGDTSGGLTPFTAGGLVITTAREAADVMDDLVRRCALVEVTWDQQVRVGHLESFVKRWHNVHDLEWEMHFTWISRGEPTGPAVISSDTSVSETSGVITKQTRDLNQAARPPFATAALFQATLAQTLSRLNTAAVSAQGAVTNLSATALAPFDAARRTIAICNSIIVETDGLYVFFTSQVSGMFDSSTPLAEQPFGKRLVAAVYVRTMLSLAAELRRTAIERQAALLQFIVEDILGTYRARVGDNLRDVSQIYYKTPNEWQRLLLFNELQSPALVDGQVILVPKISGGGAQ